MAETFTEYLDTAADRWPEREALVFPHDRLTFRNLRAASRRLARSLLNLGIQEGDRVGIWLENGSAWAIAFWACARIGATVVPLNTRWTPSELRFALDQAAVRLLFMGERFRKVLFAALLEAAIGPLDAPDRSRRLRVVTTSSQPVAGMLRFADLLQAGFGQRTEADVERVQAGVSGDPIAVIHFTSGSTAFPKGVMLRQWAMLHYVRCYGDRLGMCSGDRLLCQMPFFHIAGINHGLLVPAVQGATLVTAEAFDTGTALRQLLAERCTAFGGVASMYFMLADHPDFRPDHFAGVEKAWILGSVQAIRKAHAQTGVRGLVSLYGATELSGGTTFGDVRDPLTVRLSNMGRPLPGIETRIVDPETGAVLPPRRRR